MRILAVLLTFLAARPALAGTEIACGMAESGVIVVDGILQDWRGVRGFREKTAAPDDAGMVVRCNYDDEALYLSVNVLDDRLVRTRKAARNEDHLEIRVGRARLVVHPADPERRVPRKVVWRGPGTQRDVQIADSLQRKGWSVEIGIPFSRLPGFGKGTPALPFEVTFRDVDLLSKQRVEDEITTGDALIAFEAARELYRWFMSENGIRPADVQMDLLADMDGAPGLERVIVAGKVVGILSETVAYLKLPAQTAADIQDLRIIDLAGGGRKSLLVRYRERGNGGSRDVLAVFNLKPTGEFVRTFAHEVRKELQGNVLENQVEILPRAEYRKRARGKARKGKRSGHVIVITAGQAVGFREDNYREMPAQTMHPVLLPWGQVKKEVWEFDGFDVLGGPVE